MSRTLVCSPEDDPDKVYLGSDTETGEEVFLRYEDRALGVTIIGKAGTGKSTVLENQILDDLAHGTPGMVIDPHGQLAEQVIRRATPEQAERIILLEAIRTKPFGLNLLAVREPIDEDDDPVTWAADSVVGAVKRLYGEDDEFLPRLERYLDLAVRTLIPSGLTLLEAPQLFTDKVFRNTCLARVPDAKEREGLEGAWRAFDRLRPEGQITHTEALVNRLERLLTPSLIQGIVGSKRTTVPFDRVLSGNSMLIVSLPSEKLSPERCNFIGALMLCALADRIFARRVVEKPPRLHLYLDEYQRFATSTTADLLTQGRKYEVGLTLAHQDLHQIRDSFIRNSARHAGTLIILAVTRPDAEELAGEFPIKPREEWMETIREIDGTEPKLVPSATQAEDLYLKEHSDPLVDLAARSLLTYGYPKEAKSYRVPPRPDGEVRASVQVSASDVNDLLYKAANGEVTSPEPLTDFLTDALAEIANWDFGWRFVHPRVTRKLTDPPVEFRVDSGYRPKAQGFVYYGFHMESPDLIPTITCLCYLIEQNLTWAERRGRGVLPGYIQSRCPAHHDKQKREAEANHNTRVWEQFDKACREYRLGPLRNWLLVHLQDRQALCDSVYTEAFKRADAALRVAAFADSWWELFKWRGGLDESASGLNRHALLAATAGSWGTHRTETTAAIELLRERLRWLVVLCDGVSKDPILVTSGEQQPSIRTRHILHPRQTEQDALNEFAGKLVHPPERHVAHVRMPQAYHQVKLAAPSASTAPDSQVEQVRKRSQEEYHRRDLWPEPGPPGEPELPRPEQAPGSERRRITRRPRGEQPRSREQPQAEHEEKEGNVANESKEPPLEENGDER
jgi:hypothetical protein